MTQVIPAQKIKPLTSVLDYRNDNILYKFMETFDVSFDEANFIFEQTKKWLWICALQNSQQVSNKKGLFIDPPLLIIDEMWHTFILFTGAYLKFCKRYFGFFIHHSPTTKAEKDASKELFKLDFKKEKAKVIENTENQYNFIYDNLGEETLLIWYSELPKKYSRKQIDQLKILQTD